MILKVVRTIVAILILVGGYIIFDYYKDYNELEDKHREAISNIEGLNVKIQDYQDSLKSLDSERDSIQQEYKEIAFSLDEINKEKKEIEEAYKDSIEALQSINIYELIDKSEEVVKRNDTLFVMVPEDSYRDMRSKEMELKKMSSLVVQLEAEIDLKDYMIKMQNHEIDNLDSQLKVKDGQLEYKDSIIDEKDNIIDVKDKENNRLKWQRNGIIGGAVGVIILILI